jgi:hypothetical protein|tara:strand:- start:221 stop:637 length:417 start_codon:yes stop_codon:yes gene_type:complete
MADNDLYIQIRAGHCFEHPCYESNLKMLFPDHDFSGDPPQGFAKFVRVPPPIIDIATQRYDNTKGAENCDGFCHNGCCYEKQPDGSWKDIWYIRNLTAEEQTWQTEWQALLEKQSTGELSELENSRLIELSGKLDPSG